MIGLLFRFYLLSNIFYGPFGLYNTQSFNQSNNLTGLNQTNFNNSGNVSIVSINGNEYDDSTGQYEASLRAASIISPLLMTFINDSSVTFGWNFNISSYIAELQYVFEIEYTRGQYSQAFTLFDKVVVNTPNPYSNLSYYFTYTAIGLFSSKLYSFRVMPLLSSGRGSYSNTLTVQTLPVAVNYWEPVIPRRLSLGRQGLGYSYPVTQRPHLDPGVEVYKTGTTNNSERYADPATSETPVLPSGRRGHSMVVIDQTVIMFGGKTNGYSCATVYTDTLNLGNSNSGIDIIPCSHQQLEVNELWLLDLSYYQWAFFNTSEINPIAPPPRELHSSVVVNGNMYIFGGKRRLFTTIGAGSETVPRVFDRDDVYGDLWKLTIVYPEQFMISWPNSSTHHPDGGVPIPQTSTLFVSIQGAKNQSVDRVDSGPSPRLEYCIDKVIVKVEIYHTCMSEVRISLLGPGPSTGSPNYFSSGGQNEVLLYDRIPTNGSTGCAGGRNSFVFDDDSTRLPETCCTSVYGGTYKPMGPLAEFIGESMAASWTLSVQDFKQDQYFGHLISWSLEFTASPCNTKYTWKNLTSAAHHSPSQGVYPPPRYGANAIVYGSSFFIFGGNDVNDVVLDDLYRFDTTTDSWIMLQPVNFDIALGVASNVGSNLLLSSWGLLRYGGYNRLSAMTFDGTSNYDTGVYLMDPVTLRWTTLNIEPWPNANASFGRSNPSGRYLSSVAFVPSHLNSWETKYSNRNLYDQKLNSLKTNYEGAIADSMILFGGFDGATGTQIDGSSAGYLQDLWMLRFANWSTDGVRSNQQSYLNRHCAWRLTESAIIKDQINSCIGNIESSPCDLRDLILLAWCSGLNQTVC